MFQCIAVAVRVEDLAEVLAIGSRQSISHRLDAQEAILSACPSLIAAVNIDGSPVMQFSHFSVKVFLSSDHLRVTSGEVTLSLSHCSPVSTPYCHPDFPFHPIPCRDHIYRRSIENFSPSQRFRLSSTWVDPVLGVSHIYTPMRSWCTNSSKSNTSSYCT